MTVNRYRIENRGTDETPFGFVYLGEDARAYFALVDGQLNVGGPGSGYWKPFTKLQLQDATSLLLRTFDLQPV